jgi:hypothetical protein
MIASHRLKPVLLLIMLLALAVHSGAVRAQQATPPVQTTSLPLNQPITGSLTGGQNERITYTLEMPANHDVVIALKADRVILDSYCMQITAQDAQVCQTQGGGGDGPISITRLLPANGLAVDGVTVEITLHRPNETIARYSLAAYTVPPRDLTLGETLEVVPDEAQPYQVYTLDIDQAEPFTITIEEDTEAGTFLWAAYEIHMVDIPNPADSPLYPVWLDGASTDDTEASLDRLQILSFGGDVVYVLVEARSPYILHTNPVQIQPLAENLPLSLSLSYRTPIQVVLIDVQQSGRALITATVTEGSGAIVRVYAEDNTELGGLRLGGLSASEAEFRLRGTIGGAVDTGDLLYFVAHLPFEFTRESLTVEVEWQRASE